MCLDDAMLSAYFDGEIETPFLQELEAHIQQCQKCQAKLASWKKLSQRLRDEPETALDAAQARVYAKIEARRADNRRTDFFHQRMSLPVPLAAAAAFLLFVGGLSLAQLILPQRGFLPAVAGEQTSSPTAMNPASSPVASAAAVEMRTNLPHFAVLDDDDYDIVIDVPISAQLSVHGRPQYVHNVSSRGGQ